MSVLYSYIASVVTVSDFRILAVLLPYLLLAPDCRILHAKFRKISLGLYPGPLCREGRPDSATHDLAYTPSYFLHPKYWLPIKYSDSNYGSILYHFRDKARYWSIGVIFHTPPAFEPRYGGLRRNIAMFDVEKLEWCGYPTVKT